MNENKFPVFTYFVKKYISMEKKCSELMIAFKFEPPNIRMELKNEVLKLKEMEVSDVQAYLIRNSFIRMNQKQVIKFLDDILNGLDS